MVNNYIWFDIGQKEQYKDKNGVDRTNLSFFSARIYKEYMYKINLEVGKDIYVKGIPKGYIDKKGYRQNYIHVLEINGKRIIIIIILLMYQKILKIGIKYSQHMKLIKQI